MFLQIIYFLFFAIFAAADVGNQHYICTWLSGAAYCGKEKYGSMIVGGPAEGFVYYDTLYDMKSDLQGFIGVLPSSKSIYVVYRGSSSALNWIYDMELYNRHGFCSLFFIVDRLLLLFY